VKDYGVVKTENSEIAVVQKTGTRVGDLFGFEVYFLGGNYLLVLLRAPQKLTSPLLVSYLQILFLLYG